MWYSTPSILALMTEFGDLEHRNGQSLRLVLFAGEVFPLKHLRALTQRWPWAAFYNLYGPTETNVCTFARIPLPVPDERVAPYPIGWPCAHCDAMVLDEEGGREVAAGMRASCTLPARRRSTAIGIGLSRTAVRSSSATGAAGTTPAMSSPSIRRPDTSIGAGATAW